jgi:hypothetical protein
MKLSDYENALKGEKSQLEIFHPICARLPFTSQQFDEPISKEGFLSAHTIQLDNFLHLAQQPDFHPTCVCIGFLWLYVTI